jgi:N-acetyl-anhydromuramyl-L-alanine amidase AmpD
MELVKVRTNNYWKDRIDENGVQHKPRAIVLHITDGSFLSTKSWFMSPLSSASSNYVVDTDGTWYQFVNPKHAAWANGRVVRPTWQGIDLNVNPNFYTISVEVVNRGGFPSWNQ